MAEKFKQFSVKAYGHERYYVSFICRIGQASFLKWVFVNLELL